MEEYLDGPEVDVDLVFSQGEPVSGTGGMQACGQYMHTQHACTLPAPCCMHARTRRHLGAPHLRTCPVQVYGAVTDNWPTIEPYFNETGRWCQSVWYCQLARPNCAERSGGPAAWHLAPHARWQRVAVARLAASLNGMRVNVKNAPLHPGSQCRQQLALHPALVPAARAAGAGGQELQVAGAADSE